MCDMLHLLHLLLLLLLLKSVEFDDDVAPLLPSCHVICTLCRYIRIFA